MRLRTGGVRRVIRAAPALRLRGPGRDQKDSISRSSSPKHREQPEPRPEPGGGLGARRTRGLLCSDRTSAAPSRSALAATIFGAGTAHANKILGGSFEAGQLGAWTTTGDVTLQTAAFGSGPTLGSSDVLVTNLPDETNGLGAFGADAITAAALETFLGLPATTLDGLVPISGGPTPTQFPAIDGSGLYQVVSVDIGDTLSFEWNFLTNEPAPTTSYNDFFFWAAVPDAGGPVIHAEVIADSRNSFPPANASATPFSSETGWDSSYSYTFTDSGLFRIIFGTLNVRDGDYGSGALIDNVVLVPEPRSAALVAIGLLGLARFGGRRAH